jgi:hypothetical protein
LDNLQDQQLDDNGGGGDSDVSADDTTAQDTTALPSNDDTSEGVQLVPDKSTDTPDDSASEAGATDTANEDETSAEIAEWQGKYNTLESKYNAVRQESKKMSQDIEALTSVIVEQNEADLGGLSEEDKALVLDLAGDDPVAINKMFRKLRGANKIGTRAMTKKDDTRVASDNSQPGRPKTWEDADKRFAARMSAKTSK